MMATADGVQEPFAAAQELFAGDPPAFAAFAQLAQEQYGIVSRELAVAVVENNMACLRDCAHRLLSSWHLLASPSEVKLLGALHDAACADDISALCLARLLRERVLLMSSQLRADALAVT